MNINVIWVFFLLGTNQNIRCEPVQGDEISQSIRRLTPPRSPTPPDSEGDLIVVDPMASFLPPPGRTCGCTELVCSHRYSGRLDDNLLQQFLNDTRLMTEVQRFILLCFFTLLIVFFDLISTIFVNKIDGR